MSIKSDPKPTPATSEPEQTKTQPLTGHEQKALRRAEGKIAKGLKLCLEVGQALNEIRQNRLYRERYDSFEDYCEKRWDLSRPRAYELCGASSVIADLSAIADIPALPANEAQARPLTRLRSGEHRKDAWLEAVRVATRQHRPVTARDVEAAVTELTRPCDGSPVTGVGGGAGRANDAANNGRFWLIPPEIYAALGKKYGPFDFDPCPHPRPDGYDSLVVPWGRCNFVNPPFHREDGIDGQGPTAFVRKAIAEQKLGKTSVLTLPVQSYVNLLLEAGAELHSLGRVRWREATTGEPMDGPSPICCFVLRGMKLRTAVSPMRRQGSQRD